ncbi:MAG: hypothetical protein WDN30_14100 [Pararobbsia sp.]
MSDTNDAPAAAQPTTDTRDFTPTDYALADPTGKIVVTGRVPAFMVDDQQVPAGHTLARGAAHIENDHVPNGKIAPRPANPAALSGNVLTKLPVPSTVTINGIAYQVGDGELDMTFPQPGVYAITVSSPFPFLDATFTLRS